MHALPDIFYKTAHQHCNGVLVAAVCSARHCPMLEGRDLCVLDINFVEDASFCMLDAILYGSLGSA